MSKKIDVVIIGGGPGGTPAALHLASKGKNVLLVEKSGKLGGACLFVGCVPSKIIKHGADEYHSLQNILAGLHQSSSGAGDSLGGRSREEWIAFYRCGRRRHCKESDKCRTSQ